MAGTLAPPRTCPKSLSNPTARAPRSKRSAPHVQEVHNPTPTPETSCSVQGSIRGMSLPCPFLTISDSKCGPIALLGQAPESGGLARSAGVVPKRPFLRMTLRNHTLLRITNRRQSKRKIEVPPDPASFKSEQHSKHRVQPTKSN